MLSSLGLLASLAGVAKAETPKLVSYGNFPATNPVGVAVDRSSSDVYVTSIIGQINDFDASGRLLSPPSPFGSGEHFSGVAVAPNGDVYAINAGEVFADNAEIGTYERGTGNLLSSFSVAGSANTFFKLTWVQLAADAAANVYLPNAPNNEVQEFDSSGALVNSITGSAEHALSRPTGVAVDTSGNVWIADNGNERIERFDSSGAFLGEIHSEGVQAVAVDSSHNVYALVHDSADPCGSLAPPCYHVVEYSATGTQLADIGAGSIGEVAFGGLGGGVSTLAVDDSSGRVYVADGEHNLVWIFGPPTAPVVSQELAVEIGATEAKLGARIGPGGVETNYSFEYGTTTSYGQKTPIPEGNAGTGLAQRTVWATASGLAPGTTYHYRVVATNALGSTAGADRTFTTPPSAGCGNEAVRTGFSARLPDCRAYEVVTTPNKTSSQADPFSNEILDNNYAAADGNRMSYRAYDVLPGSLSGGESYVSTRGEAGWSSEGQIPLLSYTSFECPLRDASIVAYSADLSLGVLSDGGNERAEGQYDGGCGAEVREIVSGEPLGYENLLLRGPAGSSFRLVNVTPAGVAPADAHLRGASSDLSRVVFSEQAQLVAGAPPGEEDLYEWAGEAPLRLVTVLPDGTPVAGALAENGSEHEHAVFAPTAESATVPPHTLFTANGNLYARVNPEREQSALVGGRCSEAEKGCTVQLDASQSGGSGGGGQFIDASADGSRVLFTDDASAHLTEGTQDASGANLYSYDLQDGSLTDLTPSASAEVEGVAGLSKDGSYVYLVARAVLPGSEPNQHGETAQSGEPNLYVSHDGKTAFVATLSPEDACARQSCRVSPSGAFIAFASKRSLTGYDNTSGGFAVPEVFLYNAASGELACASCDPSGEPPVSGVQLELMKIGRAGGAPRFLSSSGQVFFDTADALLPSDTNGQTDVYEYENGQLHLLSTGTSSSESLLLDASEGGRDVFFLTRQKLLPQDTEEEARNIYDAHVDGGFPTRVSPPPCTTADACRPAASPQPPIYGAPSSETFSGRGNVEAAKAKAKHRPSRRTACKGRQARRKHKRAACKTKRRKRKARSGRGRRRS
jgi:hypothetical protein